MERPMGGGEGKVEEKGFVLGRLLEEGDGLLADGIGEVIIRVLHEFLGDKFAVPSQAEGSEETAGSPQNSVKAVETNTGWPTLERTCRALLPRGC